jgi:hypothetical protein
MVKTALRGTRRSGVIKIASAAHALLLNRNMRPFPLMSSASEYN